MLNENIRNLRKARGLSQEELAAQLHIVRQTLSKWETGLSVPDAEMLTRIAAVMDVTVNALLGESLPEPEATPTLAEVTEKLAQINAHLAREQARRRRIWRIVCAVVLMVAVLSLLGHGIAAVYSWSASREISATVGVIGGADGPTRVFVSSVTPPWLSLAISVLAGAAAAIGLIRLRKGGRA